MEKLLFLVVEDEKDVLLGLKHMLEGEFTCIVDTAASGEEAVKKMIAKDYSLVLLDIKMPEKSGLEVLKEVKDVKALPKVLVVSAWSGAEMVYTALQAGAVSFIEKRSLPKIKEKIEELLRIGGGNGKT